MKNTDLINTLKTLLEDATPAPWLVEDDNGAAVLSSEDGRTILRTFDEPVDPNIMLAALAPEMARVLMEIDEIVGPMYDMNGEVASPPTLVEERVRLLAMAADAEAREADRLREILDDDGF